MLTAKTDKAGLIIAVLLTSEDFTLLSGNRLKPEHMLNSMVLDMGAVEVYCVHTLKISAMLYDDGTTKQLEHKR